MKTQFEWPKELFSVARGQLTRLISALFWKIFSSRRYKLSFSVTKQFENWIKRWFVAELVCVSFEGIQSSEKLLETFLFVLNEKKIISSSFGAREANWGINEFLIEANRLISIQFQCDLWRSITKKNNRRRMSLSQWNELIPRKYRHRSFRSNVRDHSLSDHSLLKQKREARWEEENRAALVQLESLISFLVRTIVKERRSQKQSN